MTKSAVSVLASMIALTSVASADDALATKQLAALRDAAKCADPASPFRPWCIAADFDKGTAPDLPKGKILVGITVELETGKDAKDALINKVSPAVLAFSKSGEAIISNITPSNDTEKQQLLETVANLSLVLKGKAESVKLPTELADYLKVIAPRYKTTKAHGEWTWQGQSAARLRKVGKYWVSVETPAKGNGIWAAVYTDAWK